MIGTSGLAQDTTTQNFWRTTREPVMTPQPIPTIVVGNIVNLSWTLDQQQIHTRRRYHWIYYFEKIESL